MTKNTVELLSYLKKIHLVWSLCACLASLWVLWLLPPVQRNACYLNWLTVNGGLSLYVSLRIG